MDNMFTQLLKRCVSKFNCFKAKISPKIAASERTLYFSVAILTSFAISLVITSFGADNQALKALQVGELTMQTIKSPKDLMVIDKETTDSRKQEAVEKSKRAYIKTYGVSQINEEIDDLFSFSSSKLQFEEELGFKLSSEEKNLLLNPKISEQIKAHIKELLAPLINKGIILNKKNLKEYLARGPVVLIDNRMELAIISELQIYSVSEALQSLTASLYSNLELDKVQVGLIQKFAKHYLKPNVIFDAQATDKAIIEARNNIKPVYFQLRRGEVIARAGDVINESQYSKLLSIKEVLSTGGIIRGIVGLTILFSIILALAFGFSKNCWPNFKPKRNDLLIFSLTLVGSLFLIKASLILATSLGVSFPDNDVESFSLGAPLAAGGMVLQATLGAPGVFIFAAVFSLATTIFLENNWLIPILVLLGNVLATQSLSSCLRRSSFLYTGLKISIVNLLVVISYIIITPDISGYDQLLKLSFAFFGGLASGVIAAGLTPIAEYIGGYVTNIKLLELASMDRPLLRDLSVQAPGTWNHSVAISQMGEVAAEAIGANQLLMRVGAYYHDIGKMKKPGYFKENQVGRENKHDKLSPSMSTLIIKAHVKDGLELAKQHKLPAPIVDLIAQHHGTSLIEYFYEKAKCEASEGEVVEESHYRYSGPKPQTKEAGILMLADAVEAASRTMADPTLSKIQGLVQKMINKIFASGQLNESNLTLKELHLIAKSFTRTLTGIYHRRVEYAEPAEKIKELKLIKPKAKERVEKIAVNDNLSGDGSIRKDQELSTQITFVKGQAVKPQIVNPQALENGSRATDSKAGLKAISEASPQNSNNKSSQDSLRRLGM